MKLTKEFIEQQGYTANESFEDYFHSFHYLNKITNQLYTIMWNEKLSTMVIDKTDLNNDDDDDDDDKALSLIYMGTVNSPIKFIGIMLLLCKDLPWPWLRARPS